MTPRSSCPSLPAAFREPPPLPTASPGVGVDRGTILLVNPFYPKDPWGSLAKHVLTPATTLTTLAAATPPGWRVAIWDENLLRGPIPATPVPEIVGITVHVTFADRAYRIARTFRRLGSRVVLGGLHVTACPDEAALHADAIVVGDGVPVWPEVLGDLRAGRSRGTYRGSYRAPVYADHPAPARDRLPRHAFLTTASLVATRGCRNRCDFCYLATAGLDQPAQRRRPAQVVAELQASAEPYAVFIDNNLGADPAYLRDLCRALRPIERIWSAAVTLDVTDDRSLVRDMALAGCTGVFIGLESLSAANLVDAHKRGPGPDEYLWRVRLLQDHGIQVNGSFVLGFDHDTPTVFDELTAWVDSARLECATYQILTPYPGTPLFARLEAEGRILHRDWRLYDTSHTVFRPRWMTPEQLEEGYASCYRHTFGWSSIWRRHPTGFAAAAVYLAMTGLYKRCNPLWGFLIRTGQVHRVWRPMVELSRLRHLIFRRRLARQPISPVLGPAAT